MIVLPTYVLVHEKIQADTFQSLMVTFVIVEKRGILKVHRMHENESILSNEDKIAILFLFSILPSRLFPNVEQTRNDFLMPGTIQRRAGILLQDILQPLNEIPCRKGFD